MFALFLLFGIVALALLAYLFSPVRSFLMRLASWSGRYLGLWWCYCMLAAAYAAAGDPWIAIAWLIVAALEYRQAHQARG